MTASNRDEFDLARLYVGDPLNVVRKVVATGPPQPVPLELHDEPFAGFPEVAVSGVPLGGVELSD